MFLISYLFLRLLQHRKRLLQSLIFLLATTLEETNFKRLKQYHKSIGVKKVKLGQRRQHIRYQPKRMQGKLGWVGLVRWWLVGWCLLVCWLVGWEGLGWVGVGLGRVGLDWFVVVGWLGWVGVGLG